MEASSHVQRAVSEPTVPTGSSIGQMSSLVRSRKMFSPADVMFVVGYGSARGEGDGGWRSPTLSESSEDFPG